MTGKKPSILVLGGQTIEVQQVVQALSQVADVSVMHEVDKAIQAIKQGRDFQAIFCQTSDFMPLERAIVDQQAGVILNMIGEGICIVDDHGRCVWANQRMKSFPAEVSQKLRESCSSALSLFTHQVSPAGPSSADQRMRCKKFGFQVNEEFYEVIVSPVADPKNKVRQVVAVVWDATSGRRLQQKIDAIDAAGRELVRIESEAISKLNVAERLRLLEEKIIRYTTDLMHFDHFVIRLLNKKTNKLEPVISVGLPREALEVDLYAEPEGNGISGWVAATGRSYICNDVEKDPRYVTGLGHAKSSLTVPLRLHDKVIGVFNIESQSPGAFHEEDRQFSEIFGRYIAMALNVLDLLVVERYTVSGRMAENVLREMAGPLNDIAAEAQTLIEEYIGNDDLRHRLNKVVEDVEAIRKSVREVTQGPKAVLGAQEIKPDIDPVIKGKRILVADDEANIRNTIADVLAKLGAAVTVCKDGHEAAGALESQRFELVVSDIRMPHRNGYEIFAAARRVSEELPVILMTGFGYDPSHSIVRASQEGLAAVLYKPFKIAQLLDEIRKALTTPIGHKAPSPS